MRALVTMTVIESSAVLAGLRLLQQALIAGSLSDAIVEIATNGGEHAPLEAIQIDALCEHINADDGDVISHPFQAFVEEVAGTLREQFDDDSDISGDDAYQSLNELVSQARELLGQPQPGAESDDAA